MRLHWSEFDGDRRLLGDGKTGSGTVSLASPAERILEPRPRYRSAFVFPAPRNPPRQDVPDRSIP